jgi:hypothetical protein
MAPQMTIRKTDLLGCWTLVEAMEDRGGTVRPNPNYGDSPTGFLHYLAEGRVAVVVSLAGRAPLSIYDRRKAPDKELAEAARTFDAYAGSFTLRDDGHVAHRIEISTFQNDVGKDLVRRIELAGNRLTLHIPVFEDRGQIVKRHLTWERVRPSDSSDL